MTTTFKRGEIRNMASYDRGVWDWSVLNGCFGATKISPTDIDGCIERKGRKLFIETKQPGAPVPQGQMMTLMSLVDDGHTVIIVWGTDEKIETIYLYTPFNETKYENADMDRLRWLVSGWYADANDEPQQCVSPQRLARVLHARKSADYRDTLIAELSKLDELESL